MLNTVNQIKVRNMRSPRTGNKIANQFVIDTPEGQYFQSYETIIAFYENKTGITYLDKDAWNYSVTTSKYRNEFLSCDTQEVKRRIKDGSYKLIDLN